MCSVCRSMNISYTNTHSVQNCPYKLACYCSFCGQNGHTTTSCPFDSVSIANNTLTHAQFDPNAEYYNTTYAPCVEVIDMEENIRAFLLSYNIPLSGRKEENRARLITHVKDLELVLHWIDPKNGSTKQIDPNGNGKKKKSQAQAQQQQNK